MKKEIVVATYDKNLDWLNEISDGITKTVYRKGDGEPTSNNEIKLNNVGRCVHTFFTHIFSRYDSLSDITYFCQDYPFDHWGNILEMLHSDLKTLEEKADLKIGGYYGFHNNTFGSAWPMYESQHFTNGKILRCLGNGQPHDASNLNVDQQWVKLFDSEKPNSYEFIPGGHFAITKQQIHIRTKEFYGLIINILEETEKAPWEIERLEGYIFNHKLKTLL